MSRVASDILAFYQLKGRTAIPYGLDFVIVADGLRIAICLWSLQVAEVGGFQQSVISFATHSFPITTSTLSGASA